MLFGSSDPAQFEWASCRILTHNCEQMCCFEADRGYRCSAARKATLLFQWSKSSSEHLDPSKEHLTLCFTVLPGFASFHTVSWWSFNVWENSLLLFIGPFEMSKRIARTGKHKFYWTDSAVNSLHQGIFTSPPQPPPAGFLTKQQLTQQICPALFIIILGSLEDRDGVESSFSSKGQWWFQGKNVWKTYFLVALTCIAPDLVPPSHWGGSNNSAERQKED